MAKFYPSFLLLLSILPFNLLLAQRSTIGPQNNTVIIQYEDGSVFIGELIEEGPLDMKLLLATNDTIHINKIHIKRLKRGNKDILLFDNAKFHYTKGVFFSLQFGSNTGDFDNQTDQFDLTVGYRFNKTWAAGLGFGNSLNSSFSFGTFIEANATPVFAYGRFYPFDKKVRPFIANKIGWSFRNENGFNGNHNGGFLIQPEIGVNFASRRKMRFLLSIGQQIQNIRGEINDFDPFGNRIRSKYNLWFNRVMLKIGLEWK